MSLYDPRTQANPEEYDDFSVAHAVDRAVKALESNKAAVARWFWKGLLAFNLVLWSITFCIDFLIR